jgi:glycosyltransferase involved in cell wall biosynthesis
MSYPLSDSLSPLISIVTVCFNSEKTIKKTIESVLNQEYHFFEYIIVDGDSSDTTLQIINGFKEDKRISVISEPDNGIYDAINKGIKNAKGEIIAILNSDDFYTNKSVLSKIISGFSKEIDLVYSDICFINQKGKISRYFSSKYFNKYFFYFGMMPPHPSIFVRRKIYEKLDLYKTDYQIAADFDFFLRVFLFSDYSTKYLPMLSVIMNEGGASNGTINGRITLNKEIFKSFKENNLKSNYIFIYLKYLIKIFQYVAPYFIRKSLK